MKSTRYLGLVLAVFVFTFGSAPLAHAVAAPCTSGVGSPLLFNLSEQITNDPDSSNAPSGGDWATDTITRNVQIWQDASNPTYYCAQADDTGTFTTFGGTRGISPQSGASLPEVVTGTIVGTVGPVATTTVPADAGAWGSTHAIDCQNSDSCSTIGAWMKNYFGSMFSSYDWTWTYDGGANETWTNAQPSSGDIVHVQPATVYVDPTTGDDANYGDAAHPFKTVPAAMAAVADNGKVELVATTTPYDSIAITRPITLTSASTTDKAQIDGTVTIGSDNVTVTNLDIENPSGTFGVLVSGDSNVTVSGNTIHDIGTTLTKGSAQAIDLNGGSGAAITGDTFSNNVITNVGSPSLAYDPVTNSSSAKGIYVGDSSGSGTITGLVISGNQITNVSASTTPWVPNTPPATGYASKYGRGGYGVLINFGGATTATISGNTISNLSGYWAHAIGLEGNTPNTVVSNNTITNLTDNKGGTDEVALRLEDNPGASTVTGSGNTYGGTPLVIGTSNLVVDSSAGAASGTTYPEQLLNGAYYYDGVNAFPTIQGGVNAAPSGSSVHVVAGNYAENVTINNSVSLLGPNASVNPNTGTRGSEAVLTGAIVEYAGDTTIKGFTITNPNYGGSTIEGVHVYNAGSVKSNITIENNIFSSIANSQTHGAYAVMVQGVVSGVSVSDNKIDGITSAGWAHAIEVTPTKNADAVPQNVTIDGNHFANISSAEPMPDAYAFSNDWDSDTNNYADALQTSFHQNNLTGVNVRNLDATHKIDASQNYWGSASGPTVAQADTASVTVAPWYTSAAMTSLQWPTTSSDGEASTTVSNETTLTGTSTAESDVSVTATIPSGTTVSGDASWDGTIEAPTASSTSSFSISGYTANATAAISVGSSQYDLIFNKPVELVFAGQAGKRVGWYNAAGTFTEITEVCDGADTPTVSGKDLATTTPGESCKHNATNGTDLNVWTTHFSTFTTYTASLNAPVITPDGSVFSGSVAVTMDDSGAGASIRYTTDGSDPTCGGGSGYANGDTLTFTTNTTLKAIRCDSGGASTASSISSATFSIASGNSGSTGGGSSGGSVGGTTGASTGTTGGTTGATAGTTGTTGATGSTGGTGGEVLGAAVYNFTANLTTGSKGADVTALQQFLIAAGYPIAAGATGYFGSQTKAAVIAYQKANGITPASGYVGPLTRALLNKGTTPTLSQEAKSQAIANIQSQLASALAALNQLIAELHALQQQ